MESGKNWGLTYLGVIYEMIHGNIYETKSGICHWQLQPSILHFVYSIWVFPKIRVGPPNHPMFYRVFHSFHHPFWGFSPYFWKHPFTPPRKTNGAGWNPTIDDDLGRCFLWFVPFPRGLFFRFKILIFGGRYLFQGLVGVYLSKFLTKISSPSKLPVPFGSKQKLVGQI